MNASRSRGLTMGQVVRLAAWFALITGLVEATVLVVRKYLLGQFLYLGREFVWLPIAGNLIYFGALAAVLCAVRPLAPRLVTLGTSTWACSVLAFSSVVFLSFPGLDPVAGFVLAVGLSVQMARLVAAREQRFSTMALRTTPWLATVFAALVVGTLATRYVAEMRAVGALPPVSQSKPNVLLIVMDTVRARSVSVHGYQRDTTPALKRFAARGVRFDTAIAPAPWTTPSHGTIFTGHRPLELRLELDDANGDWGTRPFVPPDYPTLAEILRGEGYRTAGFVANVGYTGYETLLDRGFIHFEDYGVGPGEMVLATSLGRKIKNTNIVQPMLDAYEVPGRKSAADINQAFLDWLPPSTDRPFFAFLNYFDAHEPYLPPPPFDSRFGSPAVRKNFFIKHLRERQAWREAKHAMSPAEIQGELDAYEGAIAYIDHQLDILFDQLEQRSALANTLVIVTADHGEQFGEHGKFDHTGSLYMPVLHVPLVIVFPERAPAGLAVSTPVRLRDLPATVLDLLHIQREGVPGDSLARYWDPASAAPSGTESIVSESTSYSASHVTSISGGYMRSLVRDRYHYILNHDGREELFDFQNDPAELHNLADSGEGQAQIKLFRARLVTLAREENLPVPPGLLR